MNKLREMIKENVCYTDLVYGRIAKKLDITMIRQEDRAIDYVYHFK
jgi:hypothetical protein